MSVAMSSMLSAKEMDSLDALARDLAKRRFGGEARVSLRSNGVLRLTILMRANDGGSLFRERDVAAPTYEVATKEVVRAIQWANP